MKVRGPGVAVILFLIYVLAVWIRMASVGEPEYPYFKGVSGTNYRNASLISETGTLPQNDTKAAWPDGYNPLRDRPNGVEYVTGLFFRVTELFSDMSIREFSKTMTIIFFCLAVFVFYAIAYSMWGCQAAAFFAAFLIAFARPIVAVTNGKEYLHLPFAFLLISLHLMFYLHQRRTPSLLTAVLAALTSIALLSAWELAPLYMALYAILWLFTPRLDPDDQKRFMALQVVALLLSGILVPHLSAHRFLFGWPFLFVLLTTVYLFLRPVLPRRFPGIIIVIAGTMLLSLILKAIRISGLESLSLVQYGIYRLRFILGKAADPAHLADSVRFLWGYANSSPDAYTLLAFLLPVIFLLPAAIPAIREVRSSSKPFSGFAVLLALSGALVFLIDRQAILFAALGLFTLAAVSLFSIRKHLLLRGIPVVIAAFLVISQSFSPRSAANITYALGSRLGLEPERPSGFLWASLGNADRELVRFIVSRTSVRDPFLCPLDLSSLVVAFAGRTTLLVPGVYSPRLMTKTLNLTALYFGDEAPLFDACNRFGARYVLYSIDFLLDRSKHSQLYLSGLTDANENSVAFKMHFRPESLNHFRLVYENDSYRLFEVTDEPQLMFVTDHPIVYQLSILERQGDNLISFYDRVVDLLVTYHTAVRAAERGEDKAAIGRFRYCLDQAPNFTKAWLGLGGSLLRMGKIEEARQVFMKVVGYAPDNAQALYYSALTLGSLGQREKALGLLDILLSSTSDRDMRQLARELRTILLGGVNADRSTEVQ